MLTDSHHTTHHHHGATAMKWKLIVCAGLNLLFVVVEAIVGLSVNSVGLLSDAGHNLGDVLAILLSLLALYTTQTAANEHFTYGYKKLSILLSLINAVILLVAVGGIVVESVTRLMRPVSVSGTAVSLTAGVGIIINGFTTLLLYGERKHDVNMRGVFLHMLTDTMVSAGVVLSGLIIALTDIVWIDPAISLMISVIIIISTYKLLKESVFLSIDAVPANVDVREIEKNIKNLPNVIGLHHLHVWAISTSDNAATIHVVIGDMSLLESTKRQIKNIFADNNVKHCTVELETSNYHCHDLECG